MVFTTIASGSNGAALPQATINVASTTGFSSTGTFYVTIGTNKPTAITYTGTTATTFTGCSGGTGTLATSQVVQQTQDEGTGIIFNRAVALVTPAVVSPEASLTIGSGTFPNYRWGVSSFLSATYGVFADRGNRTVMSSWSLKDSSGNLVTYPTGGSTTTKYYQMVGYYVTGATYESFVITGSPSAASVTNPNTGHALINTYVASFWSV